MERVLVILLLLFVCEYEFNDDVRSVATDFSGVWELHCYSDDFEFYSNVNFTFENGLLSTTFENIHLSEKYHGYLELESSVSGEVFVTSIINDDEEKEFPNPLNLFQIQFDNKSGIWISHGNFKDLHEKEAKKKDESISTNKLYQMMFFPPNHFTFVVFDKTSSNLITVIGRRNQVSVDVPWWSKFSSPIFFVAIFMVTRLFLSSRQGQAQPQPQQQQRRRQDNENSQDDTRRPSIPENENIQEVTEDEDKSKKE